MDVRVRSLRRVIAIRRKLLRLFRRSPKETEHTRDSSARELLSALNALSRSVCSLAGYKGRKREEKNCLSSNPWERRIISRVPTSTTRENDSRLSARLPARSAGFLVVFASIGDRTRRNYTPYSRSFAAHTCRAKKKRVENLGRVEHEITIKHPVVSVSSSLSALSLFPVIVGALSYRGGSLSLSLPRPLSLSLSIHGS